LGLKSCGGSSVALKDVAKCEIEFAQRLGIPKIDRFPFSLLTPKTPRHEGKATGVYDIKLNLRAFFIVLKSQNQRL